MYASMDGLDDGGTDFVPSPAAIAAGDRFSAERKAKLTDASLPFPQGSAAEEINLHVGEEQCAAGNDADDWQQQDTHHRASNGSVNLALVAPETSPRSSSRERNGSFTLAPPVDRSRSHSSNEGDVAGDRGSSDGFLIQQCAPYRRSPTAVKKGVETISPSAESTDIFEIKEDSFAQQVSIV
jgi:hypothetical protein